MRKIHFLFLLIVVAGCRTYNPSVMFKTPRDYNYASDSTVNKIIEYKITEYDQLEMHIYTNDGFRLVDVTAATSSRSITGTTSATTGVHYSVENDGAVKLPLIGKQMLKGMTLREAERFLEKNYS